MHRTKELTANIEAEAALEQGIHENLIPGRFRLDSCAGEAHRVRNEVAALGHPNGHAIVRAPVGKEIHAP